jgi:DNA-binding transcriptional MerR regulator
MRELEQRTGVHRETIRVYLREGLLPEPRRSARNVADYDEEHVRAILTVRRLQSGQRLSLSRIRRALDGDPSAVPPDADVLRQLGDLVDANLGQDDKLVPLSALRERNPMAESDARQLRAIGAVRLHRRAGRIMLSHVDAQLVALWGDMRAGGFTEEYGFDPSVVQMHVEAASQLARREVKTFLARLSTGERGAPASEMVDTALSTMLAFFGLLRTRAVLEELRATSEQARKPRPVRKAARSSTAAPRWRQPRGRNGAQGASLRLTARPSGAGRPASEASTQSGIGGLKSMTLGSVGDRPS